MFSGEEFAKLLVKKTSGTAERGIQSVTLRQLRFKDIDLSRLLAQGFEDTPPFVIDVPLHGSRPERTKAQKQPRPKVDLCGDVLREDKVRKPSAKGPSSCGADMPPPVAAPLGLEAEDRSLGEMLKDLGLSVADVCLSDFVAISSAVGDAGSFADLQKEMTAIIEEDLAQAGCVDIGNLGAGGGVVDDGGEDSESEECANEREAQHIAGGDGAEAGGDAQHVLFVASSGCLRRAVRATFDSIAVHSLDTRVVSRQREAIGRACCGIVGTGIIELGLTRCP